MQTFAASDGARRALRDFYYFQTCFPPMKKRMLLLLPVLALLAGLALACKNKKENTNAPEEIISLEGGRGAGRPLGSGETSSLPPEKPDTLFGFEGCERPGFRALTPKVHEFIYQGFRVRITQRDDEAGEKLEVFIDSTGASLAIPTVEATFFRGGARGHIFVDVGTGPDVRDIILYNLKRGTLAQVYREQYCPDGETFVSQNGGFWFYCPVADSEVTKKPDCPDKEMWAKNGLRTAYGQRYVYDMVNRGLTRKSEFICVPMQ